MELNGFGNLTFKEEIRVKNYFQIQSSILDIDRPYLLLIAQVRSQGPNLIFYGH